MSYIVRTAERTDEPFLWHALYAAAHMEGTGQTIEDAKAAPEIARYLRGWGRESDLGCIAVSAQTGDPVAAAWVRRFDEADPGFGFVDAETPELVVATMSAVRGRGVGEMVLRDLLSRCRTSFPGVSLSVRQENPAVRLYERLGFRKVTSSEQRNRVGSVSITMLLRW